MTAIKFCGITREEDAATAARLGASAVGFVFAPGSSRCVKPETVKLITAALPPEVWRTGVFVNAAEEEIKRIAAAAGLDTLQFHGAESPEFCSRFRSWRVIKAFRTDFAAIGRYLQSADFMLIDGFSSKSFGGTGIEADEYELAAIDPALFNSRIFLAGGLNAANVRSKIERFHPYGVDVSSGIEVNGIKDAQRMSDFANEVRGAK